MHLHVSPSTDGNAASNRAIAKLVRLINSIFATDKICVRKTIAGYNCRFLSPSGMISNIYLGKIYFEVHVLRAL